MRHKLLDLVGDLALAGCDLQGHITSYRSGHRLNAETGPRPQGERRTSNPASQERIRIPRLTPAALFSSPIITDGFKIIQPAYIDPAAEIADEVYIGPFCVIGPGVKIGRGTRLENNVTIMGRVTLGEENRIYPNGRDWRGTTRYQLPRQRDTR